MSPVIDQAVEPVNCSAIPAANGNLVASTTIITE
ncbi:MAG: hypothetical protein QG670_1388 [Thermoproteota archaeon]|nr:hypothetical protein [Thermoproteota archaeon]